MAYIISDIDDFCLWGLWQYGKSICDSCDYAVCFRNSSNRDISLKNAWYDRIGKCDTNIHEGNYIREGILYRNITHLTFVYFDDDSKPLQ